MSSQENPNHEQVSLFLNRLEILTDKEKEKLQQNISKLTYDLAWKSKMALAWHSAGYAARNSARNSAWVSARDLARASGGDSAQDSARERARVSGALVVRDLISTKDFEILIAPCRFLLEELGIVEPLEEQETI